MTDELRTPPGGLDIPQPLRCPRCDHLTSQHWPGEGGAGCHDGFAGNACTCRLSPEQIVAATVLDRMRTIVETGVAPPLPRTSMVVAVSADLAKLPMRPGGVNGSLRALAMYLAEATDAHAASANPSTTARLAQELRTVLSAIASQDTSAEDNMEEFSATLGMPERSDDS